MKKVLNQLAGFKGFILALVIISGLGFAGARYEIYRLSPAPKEGEIIAEKNGKWKGTEFVDWIVEQLGYTLDDEDYGRIAYKYDEDANEYYLVRDYNNYVSSSTGGNGYGTDTFGITQFSAYANNEIVYAAAWVPSDTAVYSIPCCFNSERTSCRFIMMKRGQKYVNPSVEMYHITYTMNPFF